MNCPTCGDDMGLKLKFCCKKLGCRKAFVQGFEYKPWSAPRGTTLDLERTEGRCAFCDRRLFGSAAVCCPDPDCKKAYQAVYADKRRELRAFERHSKALKKMGALA